MNTIRYKIWQWGELTNQGSNVQYNVGIATKAKRSNVNPFAISNELICLRLGLAMSLPVPLGVILDKDGQQYYASLHVAVAPEGLPPATEEDLDAIAANERLACGIVMFDSWVLNEDRCTKNISYIDETEQTFIFDHEKALFDKSGRAYLEGHARDICIGDHCLADRIVSLWSFPDWHARMMSIPESYIYDSVQLASGVGLPECESEFSANYLLERRERLPHIFLAQRAVVFPNLAEGLLDPLTGLPIEYQI